MKPLKFKSSLDITLVLYLALVILYYARREVINKLKIHMLKRLSISLPAALTLSR